MLTLLLALAALPADTTVRGVAGQEAPAVTVHRQPALPVVALRLSVLADDPPGYAGAGHLMQHLHLQAMEDQAARVGGRVQAQRTSDALVYTVVGPAAELDHLAGVLRSALRPPRVGPADMLPALNALADERAADRDIAPSYVRAALRTRLFPEELPAAGTPAAMRRLEGAPLAEVWEAMYAPERVSVVAVGAVALGEVERAFRGLPERGFARLEPLPDSVPSLAADTPQATRHWIGRAVLASGDDPAALSVAARLLGGRMRRVMPNSQVEVEHWWTYRGHALAIVVATPGSRSAAARRTVEGALAALEGDLNAEAVHVAARAVRRDLLFYGRTPERMAEIIGSFADRTGEPEAAQRFFASLDEVTEEQVRRVLTELRGAESVLVEVPPQRLVPN